MSMFDDFNNQQPNEPRDNPLGPEPPASAPYGQQPDHFGGQSDPYAQQNPYASPVGHPQQQSFYQPAYGPPRMNWLGVASVVFAVLGVVAFVAMVLTVVSMMGPNGQEPEINENDPMVAAIGLLFLASGGCEFIALILGVIGLFLQGYSKISPIIGLVVSGGSLLLAIGLMCLGIAAG